MDSFPINCHNCFSHKREFYVFLQCKHFICLQCCLCLVNFQTLTIRCCHRNTKMSEELTSTIFEEVKARKQEQNNQTNGHTEQLEKNHALRIKTQAQIYQQVLKDTTKLDKQQFKSIDRKNLGQSYVVNTFKRIDEQKTQDQKNLQKTINFDKKSQVINGSLSQTLKKPLRDKQVPFFMAKQIESPTFKQIKIRQEQFNGSKLRKSYDQDGRKQNYTYWKNHDTTKDRILAKLNYHQQKMNNIIKEHYH